MKPMKDAAGEILAIGDLVAVQDVHYKTLRILKVNGFTPKKIRVRTIDQFYTLARTVEPHRLVKIFKQEV